MQFAPIAPASLVKLIPLSEYHLVLSNELLTSPALLEFYRTRSQLGDFIIQDNPVREGLPIPSVNQQCALAMALKPTVATCPDTLDDSAATMRQWAFHSQGPLAAIVPLMGVAQGRSESALR